MGGGFLFKRQGGWNGGSQLAVGSISTDKALPCRCEEFQLNMQPICLCVGEGLLGRRGTEAAASLRHTSKLEISSVHHRLTGLPSALLCTHRSRGKETDRGSEKREREVGEAGSPSGTLNRELGLSSSGKGAGWGLGAGLAWTPQLWAGSLSLCGRGPVPGEGEELLPGLLPDEGEDASLEGTWRSWRSPAG